MSGCVWCLTHLPSRKPCRSQIEEVTTVVAAGGSSADPHSALTLLSTRSHHGPHHRSGGHEWTSIHQGVLDMHDPTALGNSPGASAAAATPSRLSGMRAAWGNLLKTSLSAVQSASGIRC
eukprot:XP_001693828.1 predicted protein [Chlamydomonas reinhardtii]